MTDTAAYPDRRTVSLESSTNNVPQGTLLNVPSAPSSGPIPPMTPGACEKAPIVGANTVNKWLDPGFLLGVITFLTGAVTAVIDVLPSSGQIDWRVTWPKVALAILGFGGSYIRQRQNTVTK
jgi:hypothetical protein